MAGVKGTEGLFFKRVFNIDVETCRVCGGTAKVIACIEAPVVIKKILTYLEEKLPMQAALLCAPLSSVLASYNLAMVEAILNDIKRVHTVFALDANDEALLACQDGVWSGIETVDPDVLESEDYERICLDEPTNMAKTRGATAIMTSTIRIRPAPVHG